jgi:hypothetical protein
MRLPNKRVSGARGPWDLLASMKVRMHLTGQAGPGRSRRDGDIERIVGFGRVKSRKSAILVVKIIQELQPILPKSWK